MTNTIGTLDKMHPFLQDTDKIQLAVDGKTNRYDFIKRNLTQFVFSQRNRADVRSYNTFSCKLGLDRANQNVKDLKHPYN